MSYYLTNEYKNRVEWFIFYHKQETGVKRMAKYLSVPKLILEVILRGLVLLSEFHL